MKKLFANKALDAKRFARQQWRAWIETNQQAWQSGGFSGSPASNGGRGLKRNGESTRQTTGKVRPPAMAGVD